MKKIKIRPVLAFLVCSSFLVLLAAFESCKPKDDEKPREEVEAPSQIISVADAKKMYDNYTARRSWLIQKYEDSLDRSKYDPEMEQREPRDEEGEMEKESFDVARYVSYDLDSIKQYIAYIEQEAKLAGEDISSLRLYFSNYSDKKEFENKKPVRHPRQNSIFLVPTVQRKDLNFPFYTRVLDDGRREAVLLRGNLDPKSEDGMGLRFQPAEKAEASLLPEFSMPNSAGPVLFDGNNSLFFNEGSSAPPPNN